jgi:hypothetical protein
MSNGAYSRSTPSRPARGRPPFWRGAAGALRLAAWSIAGVFGAALALLPVALEPGPRGRAGIRGAVPFSDDAAAPILVPDDPPAEQVSTARAAGEAFPG